MDIDECAEIPNICSHECANLWGSYRCHCRQGYTLAEDRRTCEDEDECESAGQCQVQLETKVIRMFPKISQSRRRPLLGPSLVESAY